MNKSQKSHAGEYVKLLNRAHEEIRKAAEVKKYDIVRELLEQCQEAALEFGNMIEAIEGEGVPTIPLLENYCELTYQLHEEIWENHVISPGKVYKSLRKSLVLVENSVKHDIPLRTEAVFLPYKASMWDSLESVWKAADEDPDCDAYVIPIPYYDKNPDGSFREMHYEGNDYPDYVPVTWYEDYDFAERQPDMIFIHNPYDECNFVTSVHPFFYSKNLKQFTEKLVYIPYFILGEVDPNNKQAVDGVAHFCTCPGVINADKVIVQSEAMRQVYIHVMSDFAGEDTRKYWEKKILGLGSPKVDKVLSTRKEELEVPEEWRKVIEKPDGSWKKIIFYNTSVTALLQNNERMLRKMEDVFRVFKENQEEVALLWRPHPLIKATIESMRPELWKAYEKIVEKYCLEGWGIYDDSAELDRAIEVSDAYYGDVSSVAVLCENAGKKLLFQNTKWLQSYNLQHIILESREAVCTQERIWLFSVYTNALLEIDKCEAKLRNVYLLPEDNCGVYPCVSFINVDENLYFAPYNLHEMWKFNMASEQFEMIDIGLSEEEKRKTEKFNKIFQYEDRLFLVGEDTNYFISLDLESKAIKRHTGLREKLPMNQGPIFLREDYALVNDTAFFLTFPYHAVIAFNLVEYSYEVYELDDEAFTIEYTRNGLCITNSRSEEILWTPEKDIIHKKKLDFLQEECKYYKTIIRNENKAVYFWNYEDKIGRCSDDQEKIEPIKFDYPYEHLFHGKCMKFDFIQENGECVYFQTRTGMIFTLDLNTAQIEKYPIKISEHFQKLLWVRIFNNLYPQYTTENQFITLSHWLASEFGHGDSYEQNQAGNTIYANVKGKI